MPLDATDGLSTSDATWLAAVLASGIPPGFPDQNDVELWAAFARFLSAI